MNNNLGKGSPSLGRLARAGTTAAQADAKAADGEGMILVATDAMNVLFDMLEHASSTGTPLHPGWPIGTGDSPSC